MEVDQTHRIISWQDDDRRVHAYLSAVIAALALHALIYLILTVSPPQALLPILDKPIPVQIVESPTSAPAQPTPPIAAPAELDVLQTPVPAPDAVPVPVPVPAPDPIPSPQPIVPPEPISPQTTSSTTSQDQPSAPVIIAQPATPEDDDKDKTAGNAYIPSQWALEPILSEPRLKGLFGEGFESDIDCIRSLSEDCNALRKSVFADYQLSEQDLIWTESFAHSGLTNPNFHGLSEREIRQKLAIPIAGDNAFVILPGIAIDGNLWDTLHGVNKKCSVLRGRRRCPDLKPKAADKRFNIPKKKEGGPSI